MKTLTTVCARGKNNHKIIMMWAIPYLYYSLLNSFGTHNVSAQIQSNLITTNCLSVWVLSPFK